jgi:5-methylcytosine-specific restriction endonuclease McrBC GTP-binding regulatory subunit McrB
MGYDRRYPFEQYEADRSRYQGTEAKGQAIQDIRQPWFVFADQSWWIEVVALALSFRP